MLLALVLLAAPPLAKATPVPATVAAARPLVVVLKGDVRYTLASPVELKGRQAILHVSDGSLVSVAATEIDEAATKAANGPPAAAPAPPPKAATPLPRKGGTFSVSGESASGTRDGGSVKKKGP